VAFPKTSTGRLFDRNCGSPFRPISKPGEIELRSPHITLNFFANNLDLVAMCEGVRFVNDILMNSDGMKDIIGKDYPWPIPRRSDEAMNRAILDRKYTPFAALPK
jgi:choline dehydrogenase